MRCYPMPQGKTDGDTVTKTPDWKGTREKNIVWPAGTMRFQVYLYGNKRPKTYISRDNEPPSDFIFRILSDESKPHARINGMSVATTLAQELKKISYTK